MLTRLEDKILRCVTHHIAQHGHAPTLAEIGTGTGLKSRGTIHRYIASLVRKGYLERAGRSWRGIRLTDHDDRRLTILPLAGRIASGRPIEPLPDQKEVNFSDLLLGQDRYTLRVAGDAMIDAGIRDGDMVIVRGADRAENGDIVVAVVDNHEATLRRLKKHRGRIELLPANRSLASMIYPVERVSIRGVVVGLLRLY